MKSKKIITLNIFMIVCIFVFNSCTLFEPNDNDNNDIIYDNGDYVEDYNIVNGNIILDSSKQAEFYQEWIKNTKDVTRRSYVGRPDLWGGGSMYLYMWFDEDGKELWYGPVSEAWGEEVAYWLASEKDKMAFLDGRTAIMYLTATTSSTMMNTIFIVRVLDDKIYRTESAWGWGEKITSWDGQTIPEEEISKLVVVNEKR